MCHRNAQHSAFGVVGTEIEVGGTFGKGGFFVVKEVRSITLNSDTEDNEESIDFRASLAKDEDFIHSVVQNRKFMAKYCLRDGKDCRYALKTMQEDCRDSPSLFVNTLVDMAIEFKFLSAVRHPNIIKMRALSAGDICQPGSFLILDRLYDTLTHRMQVWEKRDNNPFQKFFDFHHRREKASLAERLIVAYDIGNALDYLHNLNIIYRDLKPDNIGFDVRGDAKLFDFGLATEFDANKLKTANFKLTGNTGTMRYMAPEVAQGRTYSEKADIYSFGVLLWQIISLQKPYGNKNDDVVERLVIYCGSRPEIDSKWPSALRKLLQDCFASGPRRPAMDVVCDVLRREVYQLNGKKLVDEAVLASSRSADSARYYE